MIAKKRGRAIASPLFKGKNMKPQVVLSLFDGMSCGQIALNRLGIPIKTYYASEIDPYPIKITQTNYPDTIQLGDVCDVKAADLPKIDILLAGSPCTGFSFAGKQLAFNDPQSVLFFQFVRLLKECKPKYFLLENVKMKKEYLNVITELVGVKPVFINSALLSAQNRQRWYWTNIPGIEQPEDKKIVLRDILETNPDSYTLMSNKFSKRQEGRNCLVDMNKEKASNLSAMEYVKNGRQGDYLACDDTGIPKDLSETHDTPKQVGVAADINGHDILKRVYSEDGKSPTLNTCSGGNREPKVIAGAWRGRYYKDGVRQDQFGSVAGETTQMLELRKDEKTNTLTTVQKDNVIVGAEKDIGIYQLPRGTNKGGMRAKDGKVPSMTSSSWQYNNLLTKDKVYWRKLTPLECERLQTVPDNYTAHVSNSRRYQCLGNGWTVDVICHILKNMQIIEEGGTVAPTKGQETFDF